MLEHLNVCFRNIGGCDEAIAGQSGLVADDEAGERWKVLLGAKLLNGSEEVADAGAHNARRSRNDVVGEDLAAVRR